MEGQEARIIFLAFPQPPVDADGEMHMWDTQEIRTQVEHCCSRGDMAAKLTPVTVSRSYFAFLDPARRPAKPKC